MKEGVVKFKNFKRKEKVPFTIYGDFECINTPWNDVKGGTKQYQKHVPCGFCFQVVCGFDESIHFDPVLLRARSSEEDVAKIFVEMIEDEIRALDRRFGTPKKMILSEEDKKKFEESKLSGYDSHIFISQLGENKGKVKAIPNTDEKYISFSKNLLLRTFEDEKGKEKKVFREIRFIDSFKFMACPFAGLVSNLSPEHFVFLERNFGEKHKLLSRKGIYPYDWMSNSFERFEEDSLLSKEDFYSQLSFQEISEKDFEFAQKIWKEFSIKDMGEYHDLYLKTDVLLLTDVFEQFRKTCLEHYELDPCWLYTAPVLAWDALLKHSKADLKLLTDPDMLLSSIYGGPQT